MICVRSKLQSDEGVEGVVELIQHHARDVEKEDAVLGEFLDTRERHSLNPGSNLKAVKVLIEDVAPMIAKFAMKNNLRHKIPNEELKARFSALLRGEVSKDPLTAYRLFLTFWPGVDKLSQGGEDLAASDLPICH